MEAVYILFQFFSPFSFIVLDLAATKFTPETPEVLSGLQHFTPPSISTVVRMMREFKCSVNYPLKAYIQLYFSPEHLTFEIFHTMCCVKMFLIVVGCENHGGRQSSTHCKLNKHMQIQKTQLEMYCF